jgi:hypothetical protein
LTTRLLALAILALGVAVVPYSAEAQYSPESGSLGGTIGVPFFITDSDMKTGQSPRIMLKYHFGYVMTEKWRFSTRGGYGWVGYDIVPAPFPLEQCCDNPPDLTKGDQLTSIMPFTATVDYTHTLSDSWMLFAGLGPGLYKLNVMNDRKTVSDPVTFERYKWWSPGVSVEGGAEFFFPTNRNVSLEFMSTYNYILSADEEKLPSGYNGNHSYIDFNFGVNVYFGLGSPKVEGVFQDEEDNAGAAAEPSSEEAEPESTSP